MIYICPKCGETENLHFNYDYAVAERPVIDILCNKCGGCFEPPKTIDEILELKDEFSPAEKADYIYNHLLETSPHLTYAELYAKQTALWIVEKLILHSYRCTCSDRISDFNRYKGYGWMKDYWNKVFEELEKK